MAVLASVEWAAACQPVRWEIYSLSEYLTPADPAET